MNKVFKFFKIIAFLIVMLIASRIIFSIMNNSSSSDADKVSTEEKPKELVAEKKAEIVKKLNPVKIIEINQENCMKLDGMASDAAQLSAAAIGVSFKSVSFIKPKWIDWSKHCNVIVDTPKGSIPCKVEAILDDNGVIFADIKNFVNEATCNNPFIE